MGIPASLTGDHFTLHGLVAGKQVFERPGFQMADMRLAICCGRTVVKGIGGIVLALFDTLLKYMVLFPELFRLFFPFHKIQICGNLLVHAHAVSSFLCFPRRNKNGCNIS